MMMSSTRSSENKEESFDQTKEEVWKEIYQNALQDREKASMLITNMWKEITSDPEKHALYGGTMSKYLERMAKSNDQLIKLAELIQKSDPESEEEISTDDVYTKILAEEE